MPASWVAASVRARLLGNRRLGTAGCAAIARCDGLAAAVHLLQSSPYGADLDAGVSLEAAQRQVAAVTLWRLRLLAGWLPPGGSAVLQPLASWFEIANIEQRLAYLSGGSQPAPYQLGRMGSAWPAVSRATSFEAVREALARSRWGDPGTTDPREMVLVLRLRSAAWVAGSVPGAHVWAATAATLLAARVLHTTQQPEQPPEWLRVYGLPSRWQSAASPSELRTMMPRELGWVLDGVEQPSDLWAAEGRWWARVRRDALEMMVQSRYDASAIVAAAALLGHDAWLVRAALSAAARGSAARREFDAVA